VTAAHCIEYGETQWVFAGIHDVDRKNDTSIQARNKTWVLKHEKFNLSINVDHDIGLIMVDPPFELNGKFNLSIYCGP
jgi:hypothetical protein